VQAAVDLAKFGSSMLEARGSRTIGFDSNRYSGADFAYVTQSIIAPLIILLFVIALVWPCQAALQCWLPMYVAWTDACNKT